MGALVLPCGLASPIPEKHQSPRHLAFIWKWNRPAMERGGRVLEPARTNFNDFVGTVAADDTAAVLDRPSLYELAHIDRDRYTIVAIDLIVDGPVAATIYAIDRVEQEGSHCTWRLLSWVSTTARFPSYSSISLSRVSKSSSGRHSKGSRSGWWRSISEIRSSSSLSPVRRVRWT